MTSSQNDDTQSQAVTWAVVIGAVLLAISLAIGVGLHRVRGSAPAHNHMHAQAQSASGEASAADDHAHRHDHAHDHAAMADNAGADAAAEGVAITQVAVGEASAADGASISVEADVVKFYFASGSADLAPGAAEALGDVVRGVAAGQKVMISGFHDTTGNAEFNAELAKQRALAVRDALMALGVGEDKLDLQKPAVSAAGVGNDPEARRVEVRLQ